MNGITKSGLFYSRLSTKYPQTIHNCHQMSSQNPYKHPLLTLLPHLTICQNSRKLAERRKTHQQFRFAVNLPSSTSHSVTPLRVAAAFHPHNSTTTPHYRQAVPIASAPLTSPPLTSPLSLAYCFNRARALLTTAAMSSNSRS